MKLVLAAVLVCAAASSASGQCSSLTTIFNGTNGLSGNAQIFFDLSITNPSGLSFGSLDMNSSGGAGTAFTLEVYVTPNTWVGSDTNPAVWNLVATGSGVAAGIGSPTPVDITDFSLPVGNHGIALVASTGGHRYSDGNGSNQIYTNADLTLTAGASRSAPWAGSFFTPRVWNGTLYYDCVSPPVTYCTSGTSTNGCAPSLSASDQPSVSLAHPCVLTATGADGQRTGIVFYGINNSGFTPLQWATGSTSFLCVKPPTQRTSAQSSGGTAGLCDGTLTLDWNAYQSSVPGALGSPWSVGDKAFVQAWYRDPPAPKTTGLSDAVELTYVP